MTKLDDALARHGIDTTTCMQRVACSYSKQAAEAMRNASFSEGDNSADRAADTVSTLDKFVDTLTSNQMLRTALQGTAIQEAMETGKTGQNCARVYRHCGFSTETMLGILAKVAATTAASTGAGGTAKTATAA